MPLVSGGVVEVGEVGLVADGIALAARIEAHKPSFVQATPSTWKAVLAAGWRGDPDLTLSRPARRLRARSPSNSDRRRPLEPYGPTETTIFSTAYRS